MNWGTKLVAGMVVFMLFIVGMGARMVFHDKDDLVEKDYYEKGESYNSDYKEQQNALDQARLPVITIEVRGICIRFPEVVRYDIRCIHPSDASKDLTEQGTSVQGSPIVIPADQLDRGTWHIEILWISHGIRQRLKQQVVIQ